MHKRKQPEVARLSSIFHLFLISNLKCLHVTVKGHDVSPFDHNDSLAVCGCCGAGELDHTLPATSVSRDQQHGLTEYPLDHLGGLQGPVVEARHGCAGCCARWWVRSGRHVLLFVDTPPFPAAAAAGFGAKSYLRTP